MNRKQIGSAILLTALLLFLPACGGEAEDAPRYVVAGEEFPALPTEEEPELEVYGTGDAVTRTYTQFTDTKQVVTETLGPQNLPSEYGAGGEIYLGRGAEEPNKTILFELVWTPESCIVISSLIPASIPENATDVMGVDETLAYVEGLSPSDLGLEGGSMDEYEVFAQDSVVLVNGLRCFQLDIYSQGGEQGGSALAGSFLMSYSGQLYRLDRLTNEIQRLEGLTATPGTDEEGQGQDGESKDDTPEDAQAQPEEKEETETSQKMAVAE